MIHSAVPQLLTALGNHSPAGVQEVVKRTDLAVGEPGRHPEADVGAGLLPRRPASLRHVASNERQIGIDKRVTKRETDLPTRSRSSDQTRKLVHPHMLQPSPEALTDAGIIMRVLGVWGHS